MLPYIAYMDPMGYEYCSMNMKIYHDKLVDHQFIWCEYCNNACELLNERGFKSDLYIEHHWAIFIQFHPYSEKRTEVSPSIESMGIWSMICLAPPFFLSAVSPWATRGPWKSAQHGALHFGSGSPRGTAKISGANTPVATWGLKSAATI